MNFNSGLFREAKFSIYFDIKRKNSNIAPSEKSHMNTKGTPFGLNPGFS